VAINIEQRSLRRKLISTAIRELRLRLGWTQLALAQKLGHKAEPGMVSRWERGTLAPHPIYLEQLKKLASRNGHEQLVQILNDPLTNWKWAVALNVPELAELITRLEIAALNGSVFEHDEENDDSRLRRVVAHIEAKLVKRYREGEEIQLWTDEQRATWLKIIAEHTPAQEITGKPNGKESEADKKAR
jgi:transcriptional regulator with XRE-family HTH domain